jgi:hypothetical protein
MQEDKNIEETKRARALRDRLDPEHKMEMTELVSGFFLEDHDLGARLVATILYRNNDKVPKLLGKAKVLLRHLQMRNPDEDVPPQKRMRHFHAGTSAARQTVPEMCYCKGDSPCEGDCKALTEVFGETESSIRDSTERVLIATYGTANHAEIQAIRKVTLQKISFKCQDKE